MLDVEKPLGRGKEFDAGVTRSQIFPYRLVHTGSGDYFNVLPVNETGAVMIIEDLTAITAWGSWHLINGLLKEGENPLTAVKQTLLELTGHISGDWLYLGSFMLNASRPNVNGHFFVAHKVKLVSPPRQFAYSQTSAFKWVSRRELKYALLDGRIGMMSYAAMASLALLMLPSDPTSPRGE